MKILITGSSGFYGSHLIDLLLKETDAEIYGVDNLHRLEDFPVDPFEIIEDKERFNERFVNWEMDYRDLKNKYNSSGLSSPSPSIGITKSNFSFSDIYFRPAAIHLACPLFSFI